MGAAGARRHSSRGVIVSRTIFVVILLAFGWSLALQSAVYAACLYLWIAYFRPESWAWSDIFTSLNLSYIAGVFLIIRTAMSGIRPQFDWRSGLLVAFLADSLLTATLGLHPDYSMMHWWAFGKTIIVSLILTTVIQTRSDLRLVLTVIVLSLGFEAGKQGWAQLILNPGSRNDNGVPFLGDNNLVAVGMTMMLPIISALAVTATGWQKRGFQFLNIGVVYRALSTYSRGGFLSIATVGFLSFLRSSHKLRTAAAVLVAALIVLPVLPQQFWDRMSTITAPADQRDDSQQSRLHFWQVAVAMANDRPLIGVGHHGFERAYNQYDWTQGQYFTNRAVHSAWFGMLSENGYPGLFLFLAILFSSIFACRRVRKWSKRGELPGPLGHYAIGLETSMIAFMVGGSFVSFHYNEMLWHFFALTMALERVAIREKAEAAERALATEPVLEPLATPAPEPEPDFVWS